MFDLCISSIYYCCGMGMSSASREILPVDEHWGRKH